MITKAQAGYIVTKTNVLCGDCVFLRDKTKCCYFGTSVSVSTTAGSCNRFKEGPSDTVSFLAPFWTKQELGYVENSAGFGCRRCEEFKAVEDGCKKVDKSSPGASPGKILAFACCDFWEKDPKRGSLKNDQLIKILSAKPAPAPPAKTRGTLTALAKAGRV
jgi:hypothetical protein